MHSVLFAFGVLLLLVSGFFYMSILSSPIVARDADAPVGGCYCAVSNTSCMSACASISRANTSNVGDGLAPFVKTIK